jgi:hypothetical protein
MAETEVENILREIRERVITQQHSGQGVILTAPISANGDDRLRDAPLAGMGNRETTADHLALINSYLTTTARSWDRLPPVVSNRSGFVASLELWCKRQLKRATRWYAWEQVNFNAAVHQALRDLLTVLSAHEYELEKMRSEMVELRATQAARDAETQAALQGQIELTSSQLEVQLRSLVNELREREEHLRAEQRVCFKQLSLETREAATLGDRSLRKTDTRVTELQRRLDRLEQEKSDA